MRSFIDEAEIFVKSGNGGNGIVSFEKTRNKEKGPPNGGNGGNGGDVLFIADSNLSTLLNFKQNKHFKAKNGENGQGKNQTGKSGENLIIKFPIGTQIFNAQTNMMICDLSKDKQVFLFIKGGKRGLGNAYFKSSTKKNLYKATPGCITDEIKLLLKLKTLSDIAIIGLPNAGKSSLIAKITAKKPLIADYPFTTIRPQLGVVKKNDLCFTISDIPGLIKGSSKGKGLGYHFLKHIERCHVLLHLIDISSEDLLEDYKIIRQELESYSQEIKNKREIICLNKIDILPKQTIETRKKFLQKFVKQDILIISLYQNQGIEDLTNYLALHINLLKQTS